jgi:hypothetical protein
MVRVNRKRISLDRGDKCTKIAKFIATVSLCCNIWPLLGMQAPDYKIRIEHRETLNSTTGAVVPCFSVEVQKLAPQRTLPMADHTVYHIAFSVCVYRSHSGKFQCLI